MTDLTNNPNLQDLIQAGALFFCSHSGGKDSQVTYLKLKTLIPADQLIVVHAHLGEVEWPGVIEHIENTCDHPVNVVQANWKDGSTKTFINMVEHRHNTRPEVPSWPSSSTRQCTSDLKRAPIHKFIRQTCSARGVSIAVNVTGMRAEESSARAKLKEWDICKGLTNQSRTVYEWRPVHTMLTTEVFETIRAAGEEPHWAYSKNERLSCMFCIMGCESDLRHAAEQNPALARKLMALEAKTGYSMFHKKSLTDIIAVGG